MTLCSGTRMDRHDEIVHEDGIGCPVCDALDTVNTLNDRVSELEQDVQRLEDAR